MMRAEWLLIRSGAGGSAWNMALDEALLEAMPRLGRPVLRFYGWREPAATFGYFQHYREVSALTPLRPLIRRPTGGGIVPHREDWTYSFAVPPGHEWYDLAAIESYRRIHAWIQRAFAALRVDTELAPAALRSGPGQCFVGHEQFDLLWRGRKIAGAAQRRRRDGLLVQGSVQPQHGFPGREAWEEAMCRAGQETFHIAWKAAPPDEELARRAAALEEQKYSRREYNERR